MATDISDCRDRTIQDFGEQWTAYRKNRGYYASPELLADIIEPLIPIGEVRDARVAEIGSGTGRIVSMLVEAGARHVLGIEPSAAFDVLKENIRSHDPRVALLRVTGEQIPPTGDLDFVFSIGVLHHVPDPAPILRAAWQALRPGGHICIWLYGREGNGLYLALTQPVRRLTTHLPHWLLAALVRAIDIPLCLYIQMCAWLPLPLSRYVNQVLGKFDGPERRLVIYDQLNPTYARYYTRKEACELLGSAGFEGIRTHHRHGYSWTVVGQRPASAEQRVD